MSMLAAVSHGVYLVAAVSGGRRWWDCARPAFLRNATCCAVEIASRITIF
jgi:hypothetical protein